MLGWLKRKVQLASVDAMETDIDRFILGLRGADPDEVGCVLASTYHWMAFLERQFSWDLEHPDLVMMQDISAAMTVGKCIRHMQAKDPAAAPGLMVWLHTLRASSTPELRLRGRALWAELRRGLPHVDHGAEVFRTMLRVDLDLSRRGRIPNNLGPMEEGKPTVAPQSTPDAADGKDAGSKIDLAPTVDLLVAQLRAQLIFLSRLKGIFPQDDFSAGYAFGTVDGYLQARGVSESNTESFALLSLVFLELYGHPDGGRLLARVLDNQTEDGPIKDAIRIGGSEMWEYARTLRDEKRKAPMGLAAYHLGERVA